MRIDYYAETDSLYIDLADKVGSDSREVAPGITLDFDESGQLAGIGIDLASEVVDLSRLDVEGVPVKTRVKS